MADTLHAKASETEVVGVRGFAAITLTAVAVTSAAGLVFEIALTRVFAIAQFYHFAFMSVSLALLGFGASGSVLAAFPALGKGGPRRWSMLAVGQSVTTVAAYLTINALPFDSFTIAWDRRQLLYLLMYYLVLAVPFFFTGLVVAVLLTGVDQPSPVPSHRIYAASLAGSGVGAVVALAALDNLGAAGTILLAAALAMGAALAFDPWGLAHLKGRSPQLVPWAWGINGTISVIAAATAAVLALRFGFSVVVLLGAVAYGGAALLARPSR